MMPARNSSPPTATDSVGWIIGKTPVGNYTNGGFWLVGTGFVLPTLAHGDIELARMLVRDLAANIEQQRLPEYINATGTNTGSEEGRP